MDDSTPDVGSGNIEAKRIELDAELRRAELEEKRLQREAEERRAEREHELRAKELESSGGRGLRFTSAQATVAAAVLAVLSGVFGGLVQGWFSRDVEAAKNAAQIEIERIKIEGDLKLEQEKQTASSLLAKQQFETTLILQAVASPDSETRKKNLDFFVEAGFISDPGDKIKNMKADEVPSIQPTPDVFGFRDCSASSDPGYNQFSKELLEFICKWEGGIPSPQFLSNLQTQVDDVVTVPLNEHQINALTSLALNIGFSRFKRSSLLTLLNGGNTADLSDAFLIFNKAGGRELPALTLRRHAEAGLFAGRDSGREPATAAQGSSDQSAPEP